VKSKFLAAGSWIFWDFERGGAPASPTAPRPKLKARPTIVPLVPIASASSKPARCGCRHTHFCFVAHRVDKRRQCRERITER